MHCCCAVTSVCTYPTAAKLFTTVFTTVYYSPQARREAGRGDMDDEVKSRSLKLNVSIDNLKECTAQIMAQVAALAKVRESVGSMGWNTEFGICVRGMGMGLVGFAKWNGTGVELVFCFVCLVCLVSVLCVHLSLFSRFVLCAVQQAGTDNKYVGVRPGVGERTKPFRAFRFLASSRK